MSLTMKTYAFRVILFLGTLSKISFATSIGTENVDRTQSVYGVTNNLLHESENRHSEVKRVYDEPTGAPYGNVPESYVNVPAAFPVAPNVLCSAERGCPLPMHRSNELNGFEQNRGAPSSHIGHMDNSATSKAGREDTRVDFDATTSSQHYPRNLIPQTQLNYQTGEINRGYNGFLSPQNGWPMPNYSLQTQGSYPTSQQWPYATAPISSAPYVSGQSLQDHEENDYEHDHRHHGHNHCNRHHGHDHSHHDHSNRHHSHDHRHHSYDHHHDQDYDNYDRHHHHAGGRNHNILDHSLKENTEYTEVGHQESTFLRNNALGYDSGYNDALNRANIHVPTRHHDDFDRYDRHPDRRGHNTLDHTLKENTEYIEVGHQENDFQGNFNNLDHSTGSNNALRRPRY